MTTNRQNSDKMTETGLKETQTEEMQRDTKLCKMTI